MRVCSVSSQTGQGLKGGGQGMHDKREMGKEP